MRILIATAHPYLPQMTGGLQQSADTLLRELKNRGHHASILCSLMPDGYRGKIGRAELKLVHKKAVADTSCGYSVYRSWFPWEAMDEVVSAEKPDVILVLARLPVKMALAAQKTGVPVVIKFQDVEFSQHGGDMNDLAPFVAVANSHFTAKKYHDAYGITSTVIHPLISFEKYHTTSTRKNVLFINPNPQKGFDIAFAVAAACPDIPFSFVESWPLTDIERMKVSAKLSLLKNVTFHRPVRDMRDLYKDAKILLAPSKWAEAYGRVASEAQCSGIPVVASNLGGLPEAVGAGGILLDPNGNIENWISAVKKLWEDDAYYQELSNATIDKIRNEQLNYNNQLTAWENIFLRAIEEKEKADIAKGNTDVSVIICTRNRCAGLTDCLNTTAAAIRNTGTASVELVIVDNGSSDATPDTLIQWSQSNQDINLHIVHENRKGLSNARNAGLKDSKGNLIIFTDDDCHMDINYINQAVAYDKADNKNLVIRGGRIELGDPTDLPLTIKTVNERQQWSLKDRTARRVEITGAVSGCNMVMRRNLVDKIGKFDINIGAGMPIPAAEDTDYLCRAYLWGATIEYVPDMAVTHFHGRKTKEDGKKLLTGYNIGEGALFAKYMFKHFNFVRPLIWIGRNAVKEIKTGQNLYVPEYNMSYVTKLYYAITGMVRYIWTITGQEKINKLKAYYSILTNTRHSMRHEISASTFPH